MDLRSLRLHLIDREPKSLSVQSISFSSFPRSGVSADKRRFCFSLDPLPDLRSCHLSTSNSEVAFVTFYGTRTRLDTDHCTDGRQNTRIVYAALAKKKVAARVRSR